MHTENSASQNIESLRALIEAHLAARIPPVEQPPCDLHRSMHHSLLAPGKRIRALLVLLTVQHHNGTSAEALNTACAIEMVHTASLILDDLPAMDDATMRRGQPANHRIFGEATAILAAIGLLNRAFGMIAEDEGLSASDRIRLTQILGHAIGSDGLVAGQEQDLKWIPQAAARRDIKLVHLRKTAALFAAATEMGALIAQADAEDIAAMGEFGAKLGLAFQMFDDLLDATGTMESAGKDVAKDKKRPSLVMNMGLEAAAHETHETLREARTLLAAKAERHSLLAHFLASFIAKLEAHLASSRHVRKMTG